MIIPLSLGSKAPGRGGLYRFVLVTLYLALTINLLPPPGGPARAATNAPAVERADAAVRQALQRRDAEFMKLTRRALTPCAKPKPSGAVINWRGGQRDQRWSNAANWEGGRVPGASDVARFTGESSGDALVDRESLGAVAGIEMARGYDGTLRLERDLEVSGNVVIADGRIEQDGHSLRATSYRQSGGALDSGSAPLTIDGAASVTGGVLNTPSNLMRVTSMEIDAPGVVRMGANGKLELSGDGEPLTGNGLLDTTTNGGNSVEYTGNATADVTAAGPARGMAPVAGISRSAMMAKLQNVKGGAPAAPQSATPFARLGALPMNAGENALLCAVIDTANGFAYFGTDTTPGRVVKVSLSTFARVGALTLNAGENSLQSAVIDAANGYAYFGTDTSPGIVVKVQLSTFTRAGALTLNASEIQLRCGVIDTRNQLAYFGTNSVPARVVKVSLSSFTRVGAVTLNAGEDTVRAAVIDTANGFAYFGTNTTPGIVVKINLSSFTRTGALTLNTGEDSLVSGEIDTGGGFAYFGTDTSPGIVVKVNLATFTRAAALSLNAGENRLRSAVLDVSNGFAYFGANTSPGIIVKIQLSTFTRVGAVTFNTGENLIRCAVFDPGGFAYFGANTSPGIVVKVRLSDFTRADGFTIDPGEDYAFCAVSDSVNGFAYFATSGRKIVKVNLATFTRVGALTLNPGEDNALTAVIDVAGGAAYFATYTSPGKIVKVNLSTFTRVGAITLNTDEYYLNTGIIDVTNGFAYFGTFTNPAKVVKVNLSSFTRAGSLTLTLNADDWGLSSAVIDTINGFAYFGTANLSSGPSQVIKVNLSTFTRVGAITMNSDEDRLECAVIDTTHGFAYFGIYTGTKIVKVNLSTFTRIGALTLNNGESPIVSAEIDTANGFAYFCTDTIPGKVVKVNLSGFTRVGALTLNAGEDRLFAPVIDLTNGFLYVGTDTSPSKVVKINLSTFTHAGALPLQFTGERNLYCAAIDTANGFAYFSTDSSPANVVKVNLSTFTRVGAITLSAGEDNLRSAVIDAGNGFAYFGTGTSPGKVVKVNLSTFTRVGALTLNAGEDGLTSAVIDVANGFAYFGTSTSPGIVVKVDLSSFTRVGALTLNASEFNLYSAVIDTANGFAYFGTTSSPGIIVKIQLSNFTRAGALTLNAGEGALYSAVIDPYGFAYFAPISSPKIVKIDLSTFTRLGAVTLKAGEDVRSAVIDTANGYAYLGTYSAPGKVVKVDLVTFARVGALTLNAGEDYLLSSVIDTANGFAYFGAYANPGKVVKIDLGTVYMPIANGNWSSPATWNYGQVPSEGEVVVIPAGKTVTLDYGPGSLRQLTVNGTLTIGNDATARILPVAGDVTISGGGVIQMGSAASHQIRVGGNWTNNGTFTAGSSNIFFNGADSTQTISGNNVFNNLTILHTGEGGVTLASDVTVNGVLSLWDGNVSTGANTLILGGSGSTNRIAGHVIGALQKKGLSGFFNYPVGTANGYTPLTVANAAGGGDLSVRTVAAAQSALNPAKALQEYWSLNAVGAVTADLTFNYLQADVMGDESAYRIFRITGSTPNSFANACPAAPCVDIANNTATITGVSSFSDWTLAEPSAPTAIELARFNATAYDGGVFLDWQTGFEVSNLGFNLYRDEAGRRTLVNSELIAGSALKVGASVAVRSGYSYGWWDRLDASADKLAGDAVYYLEDVDINGRGTLHGPFAINKAGGLPPSRSQAETLSRLSGGAVFNGQVPIMASSPGRAASGMTPAPFDLAGKAAVKVTVKEAGWYRVTQAELAAAGFDVRVNPRSLQLFAGGVEQPMLVVGEGDGSFDATDAIEFYASGQDSPVTDARVYWLAAGQAGKRITLSKTGKASGGGASFFTTVERRERSIYFSALLNGEAENFFGSVITTTPVAQSLALSHIDTRARGGAEVEVALQGVTDLPGGSDHSVSVMLNGAFIGRLAFDGREHKIERLPVYASLLREGDNQITLASEGGASDISLVDYVRVSYWRRYVADHDVLWLTASASNGTTQTITGFTSPLIRVFDVTDANAISEIAGQIGAPTGDKGQGYAVTVSVSGESRRLLALTDAQVKRPAAIALNQASSLRNAAQGADLLIVTRREFFEALMPLAALRQSQKLSVALVDIEDIYDEFNFGEKSPQAVKDFLACATTNWKKKPRFVLLAGVGSYDPKNYLGYGETDLVPAKLVNTSYMETASDDWYVDFNSDGMGDTAIGRLPVRNAEEATQMVSKLVAYEQANPSNEAILVADANDSFGFEQASAALLPLLPRGMQVTQINRSSAGDERARKLLLDGLNRGPKLVNYVGHGSVDSWRGGLFSANDAGILANQNHLSVYVLMTCLNSYYDAGAASLGESVLRAKGGAVAVWASTGMSLPEEQAKVNQEFYRQVFRGEGQRSASTRLGDAVLRAKAATVNEDVRRTWVLFGDPSMQLR
jgi:hypothetical protein